MPNGRRTRRSVLAGACMILLAGAPGSSIADTTAIYDCSTTDGWFVLDRSLQPASDTRLSATEGRLVFEYLRDRVRMLAHAGVELRGFDKLSIRLRSKEDMQFGAALRDRDDARFYAMRTVPANQWVTLEFSPVDFELADSSPVEKVRFDPNLAEDSYVFLDIGSYLGYTTGTNSLEVDWVEIKRSDAPAED